jgi:alkylation response protein AidB-like acyl-CoA dehydrogenase
VTPPTHPEPHPVGAAVREFVDREVRPAAGPLEHADAYPHALVARMRALGLFGALPGPLVFSLVAGMSVADISGRAIANLEVNRLRHERLRALRDRGALG